MERSPKDIRRQRMEVREAELGLLQLQIHNLRRSLLCVPGDDARARIQFFIAMNERRLSEKGSDSGDRLAV